MKILLIVWAIGLAECDKLDRTYLPPRGSGSAGGYPEDLNLPLEFPKENYSSTLKPESVRIVDNSLRSKYPNIALGIDRQGPFGTSSPKVSNRPKIFVSKNINNIPTTTTPYGLTETSTFLPTETSDGPVTTFSQGYSFPSSSFGPELSYDRYLIQQIKEQSKAPETIPNLFSQDPVLNRQAANNQNIQQNPSLVNNNNYVAGQLTNVGTPELQRQNIRPISTKTPYGSLETTYPASQYGDDLDSTSISEIISPTANIYNQQTFDTNSTPRVPVNSEGINENSKEYNNTITTGLLSTSMPDQTFGGKSVTMTPSSFKYSPSPTFFNNFDARDYTNVQPQRIQAEGDRNAVILNYENILTPEGFAYSFDTSNGIHADESGTAINGVKAKGSYSYTGDDGKIYSIEYTADENGFIPRGDHLPTAPPIPDVILRGIQQAEKNKISGIIDDGSYDDAKYGHHRYQGLMYRIPQNKYNNIILSQPSIEENERDDKATTFGNKLPKYSSNNDEVSDEIPASYEPALIPHSPDKKTSQEHKDPFVMENDKELSKFFGVDEPNRLLNSKVENINGPITDSKNKLIEDIIDNMFKVDKTIGLSTPIKSEILNPMLDSNVAPKEYNSHKEYYSGYDYSRPQNIFNGKDQNNLDLNIPSLRNNESNLDDERRNDRITAQDFIIPNSFNFGKSKPVTTAPVLTELFNDPLTSAENGITKPVFPTFYNGQSGQIENEKNKEKVFSSQEPKVTSTKAKPYYYQSPYTSNGNGEQSNIYPSSTFGSQYSVSTTPVPSEIYSTITPSTNGLNYSVVTPSTSQVTSTLRPSLTSSRPSSGTSSRPSGSSGTISEQVEDNINPTIKPINLGQRIIGRPGYQGRPNKIPVIRTGFSEIKPGSLVSTDPRTENLRVSFRPGDFNKLSSMEKLVGEDFSGPKQPQKFDPKYGYYY